MSKPSSDIDAALEGGELVLKARRKDPFPGEAMDVDGVSVAQGAWRVMKLGDRYGMSPHSPVIPLGFDDGTFYFVTARGTLGFLDAAKSSKGHIRSLYAGRVNYLIWAFGTPGSNKPDRYDADVAANILLDAATLKGPWNPQNKVRGRGAHLNAQSKLVFHMGSEILIDGAKHRPGELGGYFYTARAKTQKPAVREERYGPGNAADTILQDLKTWNFFNGETDCRLLLGGIVVLIFGGALDWRPSMFISATHGSGKSTLQDYIRGLLAEGYVQAENATPAGIYQPLGNDTVPILIDEAENGLDSARLQGIIALARISASGGTMRRGGADHKDKEFTLKSAFMMSAINPPPLRAQDASRFTFFNMGKVKDASAKPDLDAKRLEALGSRVVRAIMDRWSDYLETIELYKEVLTVEGNYTARDAQQYAPLFAGHDILMYETKPDEVDARNWIKDLNQIVTKQVMSRRDNWEVCLSELLDAQLDPFRNEKYKTIAQLLHGKLQDTGSTFTERLAFVNERLNPFGMSISFKKSDEKNIENAKIFIPKVNKEISKIYDGTDWQTPSGADGAWYHTFKFAPKEIVNPDARVRVSGQLKWGSGIKLTGFMKFHMGEKE